MPLERTLTRCKYLHCRIIDLKLVIKHLMRLIIPISLVLLVSCKRPDFSLGYSGFEDVNFELPFSVNEPSNTWHMPKSLVEISGVTILDNGQFATVNDEKGVIYVLNNAGTIDSKIDFAKDDDYEGIVLYDGHLYVGESNGNIKVVNVNSKEKVAEYKTFLSRRNNVEGLAIDAKNNKLLLACKGKTEKKSNKNKRAIYTFDLQSKKLDKEPWTLLDIGKEIKSLKKSTIVTNRLVNMTISLRLSAFAPSGIGIDPLTDDVYILSSRGNVLVVLDYRKNIKGIYLLPRRVYGQPEGLCFDKQGNLYISNEGKSTKPNILKMDRTKSTGE